MFLKISFHHINIHFQHLPARTWPRHHTSWPQIGNDFCFYFWLELVFVVGVTRGVMLWQFAPDHHVPPVQAHCGGLCLHPSRVQMVQLRGNSV